MSHKLWVIKKVRTHAQLTFLDGLGYNYLLMLDLVGRVT